MSKEIKNLELVKVLGKGAFGEVFKAVETTSGKEIAAKLESKSGIRQLEHEFEVYTITASPKVPKVYEYGLFFHKGTVVNCMTMELLGPSLEKLYGKCSRFFSTKTIFMMAIECINRIEIMHKNHILHRDIKPDNFVVHRDMKSIYLVDYGLCKQYRDPSTLIHRPYRDGKSLTGTARYASVNTHAGIEQSRRDDLESLGFMLIYFIKKKLPWQGIKAETKKEKYAKIYEIKRKLSLKELCYDSPIEILKYMEKVRELKYMDYPDYYKLANIFSDGLKVRSLSNDKAYDWLSYKNSRNNK